MSPKCRFRAAAFFLAAAIALGPVTATASPLPARDAATRVLSFDQVLTFLAVFAEMWLGLESVDTTIMPEGAEKAAEDPGTDDPTKDPDDSAAVLMDSGGLRSR